MHILILLLSLFTLSTAQDEPPPAPACDEGYAPTCCPGIITQDIGPCGEFGDAVGNLTECTTDKYPNGFMCCVESAPANGSTPEFLCTNAWPWDSQPVVNAQGTPPPSGNDTEPEPPRKRILRLQ